MKAEPATEVLARTVEARRVRRMDDAECGPDVRKRRGRKVGQVGRLTGVRACVRGAGGGAKGCRRSPHPRLAPAQRALGRWSPASRATVARAHGQEVLWTLSQPARRARTHAPRGPSGTQVVDRLAPRRPSFRPPNSVQAVSVEKGRAFVPVRSAAELVTAASTRRGASGLPSSRLGVRAVDPGWLRPLRALECTDVKWSTRSK